ncbi:MAG: magnesium transporter CorA family protein [Actinomycetota bacterium]
MNARLLAWAPEAARLAPAPLEDLDRHRAAGSLLWLDVETRDPDVIDDLGQRFGFDPAAIEDVLDVEQLPKYETYPGHLFVVLHSLVPADDRIDTHEIDCFIGPDLLVTVREQPLVGLEWLWDAVQSFPHLAEHGPDELFAQLAEVVGRRYLEVIDEFERRVDALSDRALDADVQVLGEIQLLRREEGTIRKVLNPQRTVLAALRSNPVPRLSADSKAILTDAYDVHNLVVESLSTARTLLTDTLDTYRGASAERQASATTVLTVYAAIVLPLSLITSWYGMNMGNLPAADRPWGWQVVTAFMVAVVVVSWVWFVRAGIVRRPRLRDESSLRTGLLTAAKAPVRPFTMLWRPSRRAADHVNDRRRR